MTKENETKNNDGFSIVEMLIAVAIGLIVLAGLVVVFVSQKKAYDVQAQVAEMHQNARAALDMISQDIAMAGYDPKKDPGVVGIPYHDDRLQLRADLSGDGYTNGVNEDVTYILAGTVINRISIANGTPVAFAENVEAFDFWYYKADGSEVNSSAQEDEIQKVRIELTMRTSRPDPTFAANSGYRTRTLSSEVIPRNLALNIVGGGGTGGGGTGGGGTGGGGTGDGDTGDGDTGDGDTGDGDTGDGDTGDGDTGDGDTGDGDTGDEPEEPGEPPSIDPLQPPSIKVLPNHEFTVCAEIASLFEFTAELYYSVGSIPAVEPLPMTINAAGEYCAEIPGQSNGAFVSYYVKATDENGIVGTSNIVVIQVGS